MAGGESPCEVVATSGSALGRKRCRLAGSSLVRAMFKLEPAFEHSANVAVGIVSVRAMARRAADLLAGKP